MQSTPTSGTARRARFAVAMTFLLHAAIFATWTPRIPAIKDTLDLSNDDLGIALGGMAVGLLIGTRLTGRIERSGRTARSMRIFMPLQAIALVGPAFAWDLVSLTVSLFVLGLLGGILDVVMNAHAVAVERIYARPIMSGFHGLWSLGSMSAAAIAALVAQVGFGVQPHFVVAAVIGLIASPLLLVGLLPGDVESAALAEQRERADQGSSAPVGLFVVVLLVVMGFGAFMAEGTIADWGAVFLHDEQGAPEGLAALGVSVFSAAMAVSRLTGDRIGERFGPVFVARSGAALALTGYAVFLLAPNAALSICGFALTGLGIGPVVPVVFSAGGNTRTKKRPSLLGIAVSAGYCGAVVGPMLIGAISEWLDLRWALTMPTVFLVLVILAAGRLSSAAGGKDPETVAHAHGPAHSDG